MVSSAILGMTGASVNQVSKNSGLSEQDNKGLDFSKIMNQSFLNNNSRLSDNETVVTKPQDNGFSDSDKNNAATDNTRVKGEDTSSNRKTESKKSIKEADNEEVNAAASDVKKAITNELEVTDEQLEQAMLELNMTLADLLDSSKVTELVAKLSGSEDAISFITDQDMLSSLNNILEVVNEQIELLSNSDMSKTDAVIDATDDTDLLENVSQNNNLKDAKVISDEKSVAKDENSSDADTDDVEMVLAKKTTVQNDSATDNKPGEQTDLKNQSSQNDNFVNAFSEFSQSVKETFADIITADTQMVNEADVVRQVIEQIKITAGEELKTIEVMLTPANLGNVQVSVSSKNGVLSAQITAQNEQVKAALENQVIALKEHFINQGLKIEAVEVTVQSHSFESNQNLEGNDSNQANQEKKSKNRIDLSLLDELSDEDLSVEEIRARDNLVNGNSSVEYKA